jgi:hypothetical protein
VPLLLLLSLLWTTAPLDSEPVLLLYSGDEGASVRITVPEPAFISTPDGVYPRLRGAGLSSLEGDFLRPEYSFCIPLPPGVEPEIEFSIDAMRPPAHVREDWALTPELIGIGLDTREVVPSPLPAPVPVDPVVVSVMRLAGTRMAVVSVRPFYGTSLSECAAEITVNIRWPRTPGGRDQDGSLAGLVALSGTRVWSIDPGRGSESIFWGRPWARMSILDTGFYSVTGQELSDAGIDVTGVLSATLSMYTGPGRQFSLEQPEEENSLTGVAILVEDGGDGYFDSSDSLMFFAQSLNRFEPTGGNILERTYHRYATHNVYWLTWGGESGLRMASLPVPPDGSPAWGDSLTDNVWIEHETSWLPEFETNTGWAWSALYKNTPGYFYFSSPSPEASGQIAVSLIADEKGANEIRAYIGSSLIGVDFARNKGRNTLVFEDVTMDQSLNQLKLLFVDGPATIHLDYIHVTYPRSLSNGTGRELFFNSNNLGRHTFTLGGAPPETASGERCVLFDVTDPFLPLSLTDITRTDDQLDFSHDINSYSRLFAVNPEHWKSPDSIVVASPGRILGSLVPGEAVVVAADEFQNYISPISALYAQRGRTTAMVTAGEVYDEFGQGIRDPGAIRSFFRFTQDEWDVPAGELLLVGDGNYDPLMYITAEKTLIPVCIYLDDEEGELIEDCFVIAHEDGVLPEVPISRISVNTVSELTDYIAKMIGYGTGSSAGEWCNQVVLIADDEWGHHFNETMHVKACELLADTLLPPDLERRKFYLIEYPWPPGTVPEPGSVHPEKPAARADLISLLTEGCSSFTFFGHGSYGQIAGEKLLITSDLTQIDNGPRMPLACFATCNVGQFDLISTDCLGEEFVLKPGGGSIATIAATRGTYSANNENLYVSIYDFLYNQDGYTIGEALWAGKIANPGVYRNLYNVLLGDGGTALIRPDLEPETISIDEDVLSRGNLNTALSDPPGPAIGWFSAWESGAFNTYICLGGAEITYLKYGSRAFSGIVEADGSGPESIEFFMPVQADTGSYGRCSMTWLNANSMQIAFREWIDVIDTGEYPDDSIGPEMDLMVNGLRQSDQPEVWGLITLQATLSDESGICVLGGSAGRAILMSLDTQGFDLSSHFTYRAGSYTTGDIEFELPELFEGNHRLIVAAWDGMGNGSQDTLDFAVVQAPLDLMTGVFVHPNPGYGQRTFNFTVTFDGICEISVYTVNGRKIWRTAATCHSGYNQILWDGRDMDGDFPGSGAYVYRIEFDADQSGSTSFTDVFAVLRD